MMVMNNKTVLVTGSTDGIGKQAALELAEMGAHLLLHGRNTARVETTMEEIKGQTGNNNIEGFTADFASIKQVKNLGEEIRRKHEQLDVLLNNAGVMEPDLKFSEDGFEMTFAVNHLATFVLTYYLLAPLKSASPSRIVNVGSLIHSHAIDFDNLQGEKGYNGVEAYCLSKLCNILFTYALAERLSGTGVTVNTLHPGVVNTKLFRVGWGGGASSLKEGASNPLYVVTAPELKEVTGRYFGDQRELESAAVTYNPDVRDKLWRISEELTGICYE
jgi:NAD(P)-dependent dehydrogenase (short-subunit alcohol dehydrogenase family)